MITAFNLNWEESFENGDISEYYKIHYESIFKVRFPAELTTRNIDDYINGILNGLIKKIDNTKELQKKCTKQACPFSVSFEQYIKKVAKNDGNLHLDGDLIQKKWFPPQDVDVFLSHSHKDLDKAVKIKKILEHFGLKVFVDSTVWGFAEDLLRDIDEIYTKEKNHIYSYEKRNQTTAAVYLMLSTALTQVMDNSESVFFLNTHNSTLNKPSGNNSSRALIASPWIYHEIMMTKLLRPNSSHNIRLKAICENSDNRNLIISHNLDLKSMKKVSLYDFVTWVCSLNKLHNELHNKSYISINEKSDIMSDIIIDLKRLKLRSKLRSKDMDTLYSYIFCRDKR